MVASLILLYVSTAPRALLCRLLNRLRCRIRFVSRLLPACSIIVLFACFAFVPFLIVKDADFAFTSGADK
jgi:hypothetical protein